MLNIQDLIDDAKCFTMIRDLSWPDGVCCPTCHSEAVSKRGLHTTQAYRQRYGCQTCGQQFDDLVVLHMFPNVQQTTIKPVITRVVAPGTLIYTDE